MDGGQSYFLASLPILPRRFYTRSRPFVRRSTDTVARVRKKYDFFAVYTELKSRLQFSQEEIDDPKPLTGQMTKIEKEIKVQAQVEHFANKGHVPRKSREVFGAEKPFVKLGPLYCVKPVFSYVVKGIKIKITSEFRASRRLRLKIQRESSHPKYARNVSALSRNRPRGARTIFVSMEYLRNLLLMKHERTPEG